VIGKPKTFALQANTRARKGVVSEKLECWQLGQVVRSTYVGQCTAQQHPDIGSKTQAANSATASMLRTPIETMCAITGWRVGRRTSRRRSNRHDHLLRESTQSCRRMRGSTKNTGWPFSKREDDSKSPKSGGSHVGARVPDELRPANDSKGGNILDIKKVCDSRCAECRSK